jgi:hypothetical protein
LTGCTVYVLYSVHQQRHGRMKKAEIWERCNGKEAEKKGQVQERRERRLGGSENGEGRIEERLWDGERKMRK